MSKTRPTVVACSVFGGRSPKTGLRVGSRHSWPEGWGRGRCRFCHKYLEDVLEKPRVVFVMTAPETVITVFQLQQ